MRMAALVAMGLASCTAPNPDFQPPSTGCSAGQRSCSGARPVECDPTDGGTRLLNAACPSSGGCEAGRCVPPDGAQPCNHEQACLPGGSCMPFVDPQSGNLATFCAPAEGETPGGLPCTQPGECRSDTCLHFNNSQFKRLCYLACQSDGDCTPPQRCRPIPVTVTGVQGTIQGCSPP